MLEEQDLQKIGTIVEQKVKTEFQAAEDRIVERVVNEVVDSVSELTENLEKNLISTLADKSSVNKMIDASVERDQRLNQKIDAMTGFLAQKKVLENPEVSQIQSIKVFGPLLRGQ